LEGSLEAKSLLLKKAKLRSAILQMNESEFAKFQHNLEESLDIRTKKIEEEKRKEQEEQNKINRIREICAGEGIDLDSLLAKDSTKMTSSAQYRMTDSDGKEVTWSGKGRLPKAFKEARERGVDLEQFKI